MRFRNLVRGVIGPDPARQADRTVDSTGPAGDASFVKDHLKKYLFPSAVPLQAMLAEIDAKITPPRSLEDVVSTLDESKERLYKLLVNAVSPLPAKALTIKILNLFLSKYHYVTRSASLLSSPYGIVVDPMNACQLACPGCVHSTHAKELRLFDWGAGVLSDSVFADFMCRYGPSALETSFYNYGEPLLNRNTPNLIRVAKTYLTRTVISTNMGVKHFDPEAYVNSGLDFMTMSIDGATQGVYEKFRRKGDIETVYKNIRSLVQTRTKLGKRTPVVSWQYLAFEHNEHEIDDAIAMARSLDVDQFVVASPFDVSFDDPSIRPSKQAHRVVLLRPDVGEGVAENWNPFPSEIQAEPIEQAFATNWRLRLAEAGVSEASADAHASSVHTCQYLYKNIVMDARGRILPCCAAPQKDNGDLLFGNAQSGTDLFNSEKHRLARLSFADPDLYRIEKASALLPKDLYCEKCEWNQDRAQIDTEQVTNYFAGIGSGVFNPGSIGILSSW